MLDIDISTSNKTFSKTQFMSFEPGQHRVRLLGNSRRVFTHYTKSGTIECLGSDCPICQRNKIIAASTETPEKVPGYNRASLRYYFNVLDRTLVKVCPQCQAENKKGVIDFTPTCKSCGAPIVDVTPTPSNKVKVINISKTNAERLVAMQSSKLGTDKEPIGLENFDILFNVLLRGKNQKDILPEADLTATDVVEVPDDALYDLDNIVIKLDPDEIESFSSGVSLKDIFAARKGSSIKELDEEEVDVTNQLGKLFSN